MAVDCDTCRARLAEVGEGLGDVANAGYEVDGARVGNRANDSMGHAMYWTRVPKGKAALCILRRPAILR